MLGTKVAHKLSGRRAEVSKVEDVTLTYRRLTLRLAPGESSVPWVRMAVGAHVKLVLPDPVTGSVTFPSWGPGSGRPVGGSPVRDYTVRAVPDDTHLVVEVVLHGDGPGSTWAASATPGTPVGVLGPRTSTVLPADRERYLCLVDSSGLAAGARWLEEAPGDADVELVVEGEAPSWLTWSHPRARVTHVEDEDGTGLAGQLARLAPRPTDLVWAAGEATSMVRVRTAARALGVESENLVVHGYYKRGVAGRDHKAPLDA